jgi:hypothetical protein
MEKRGRVIINSVMHIVYALIFLSILLLFVYGYKDGAAFWEDFYAKEIAYLINKAEPGTDVNLDVTRISEIALDNGKEIGKIVSINNVKNTVTVSLRNAKGTSFRYFNDVDIIVPDGGLIEHSSRAADQNSLVFRVVKTQRRPEA